MHTAVEDTPSILLTFLHIFCNYSVEKLYCIIIVLFYCCAMVLMARWLNNACWQILTWAVALSQLMEISLFFALKK